MNTAAFVLLAAVFTGYVLLDGYDLGVGALHLIIARSEKQRQASLATIGPFWSGNEVILIAAAAILFALFPRAYAAAFSGFYLPLMVVLWLLMGRGMAIELRGHFSNDLWRGFWDTLFCVCSILLAFIFGVTLGNVIRGVPLDAQGYFAGTFTFAFNGYGVLVGFLALAALALHGATFVAWRSRDELATNALRATRVLWIVVLLLYLVTTAATIHVHPITIGAALWVAPIIGFIALIGVPWLNQPLRLGASTVFLIVLMVSAAGTVFPYLLPAYPIGSGGLDIYNSAATNYALRTGALIFAIGLGAALIYATLTARRLLSS